MATRKPAAPAAARKPAARKPRGAKPRKPRKPAKKQIRGYIVYQGPSLIDGAPIVMIATVKTTNRKTGNMVQTWIIRSDMSPIEASQRGLDYSVCGSCAFRGVAEIVATKLPAKPRKPRRIAPAALASGRNPQPLPQPAKPLRRAKGRACYVNLGQAPMAVYGGFTRGIYPIATPEILARILRGRKLRLGAYGDPLAIPADTLRDMVKLSAGHTAYSHSWMMVHADNYRSFVMASVENLDGLELAHSWGWRTLRVKRAGDAIHASEIVCPATDEGGNTRDCSHCCACDGSGAKPRAGKKSVVLDGHGGKAGKANALRLLASVAS